MNERWTKRGIRAAFRPSREHAAGFHTAPPQARPRSAASGTNILGPSTAAGICDTSAPAVPATSPIQQFADAASQAAARVRRLDSLLVFIFTIAVALASFPHRSGYPLADAVEYLKDASRVESGLPMIQNSVRPFFFSSFLVPIFRFVRVFGSADGREAVFIATAVMLTISGLAAVALYRFTERLAGAPAALGAALFLAANRVFQFWAPTVATDVPCAACIAGAAMFIFREPTWKTAFATGALFGAAILFKYQAMMIVGLMLPGLPFLWRSPDRRWHWKLLFFVLLGVFGGLLVQCLLDWIGGRGFGATLWNYVKANIIYVYGTRLAPLLISIFGKESFEAFWSREFGLVYQGEVRAKVLSVNPELMVNQPYHYYWTELPQFLTWLEFGLGCLGILVLAIRRPRGWWYPVFVLAGCITFLTFKATKEWRLFVCVSPFIFVIIGTGFAAAVHWVNSRFPRIAPFLAILCLAPNLISMLGGVPLQTRLARIPQIRPLLAYDAKTPVGFENQKMKFRGWRPWQIIPQCTNPADFGGYERATHWLNQNAPAGARVSATWFWQFHFRLRPDLFLVEPLVQVDDKYKDLPETSKEVVRNYLRSLDYFVSHLQALVISPELFEFIEREFEFVTIFENPIYDETLHSIFVLKKRARPGGENWWLRVYEGSDAIAMADSAPPEKKLVFYEGEGASRKPVIELLDCDFDPRQLAEGRVAARFLWRVPAGSVSNGRDTNLQIRVRNSSFFVIDEMAYKLGFDRVTEERFKPGTVFSQRIPIRPARDLYDFARARRPGESVALSLYIQLVRTGTKGATYPLPEIARFSRLRDPDSNAVRVGSLDLYPPEK